MKGKEENENENVLGVSEVAKKSNRKDMEILLRLVYNSMTRNLFIFMVYFSDYLRI